MHMSCLKRKNTWTYKWAPSGTQVGKDILKQHGVKHTKDLVVLLKKSLYDPKQARKPSSKRLHSKLFDMGFKQCTTDMCTYIWNTDGNATVVGVYVDDFLYRNFNRCRWMILRQHGVIRNKRYGVVKSILDLRIMVNYEAAYVFNQEVMIDLLL